MDRTTTKTGKIQARSERLEARVTPKQKDLLRRAADLEGRSLSEFIVGRLSEVAQRVIEEHETIRLSESDQELFVKTLLSPPRPPKALKDAAARYKERVRRA